MCRSVCQYACTSTTRVPGAWGNQRRALVSRNRNCRWLCPLCRSSVPKSNLLQEEKITHNRWAVTPAPTILFLLLMNAAFFCCEFMPLGCRCLQKPEGGAGCPGAGVLGTEPEKSRKHFHHWTISPLDLKYFSEFHSLSMNSTDTGNDIYLLLIITSLKLKFFPQDIPTQIHLFM